MSSMHGVVQRGRSCSCLGLMLCLVVAAVGCDVSGGSSEPASPAAEPTTYSIALTVGTAASLPRCNAGIAGTTAYVQMPTSLYRCVGNTWVQLPCTNGTGGAVAYASATKTLLACVSGKWIVVETPAGAPGPAGASSSLVSIKPEPAGVQCAVGGQRIDVGPDTNRNGTLDAAEIQSTQYVCNGVTGMNGVHGAPGAPGAPGATGVASFVRTEPEPQGSNCADGGVKLSSGADINASGTLDASEVTSVSYVCNGASGAAGPAGGTGPAGPRGATALVTSAIEPPGSNCEGGGVLLSLGVDLDGDGELEATEVTGTAYVCHGRSAEPPMGADGGTADGGTVDGAPRMAASRMAVHRTGVRLRDLDSSFRVSRAGRSPRSARAYARPCQAARRRRGRRM